MFASLQFVLGLLDREDPARAAPEDFDGRHGDALRAWQAAGFLDRQAGMNPVPSCPYCGEGAPYRVGGRYLCSRCHSEVPPRHLLLWQLDREAFLSWLAREMRLRGDVRRIDEHLWQLGTFIAAGEAVECFYSRRGRPSEPGEARLAAYRSVLILFGESPPPASERRGFRCVSLLELLRLDNCPAVTDVRPLLRARGDVRFEAHSGAVFVGDAWLGEIPVGSKEYCLLRRLAFDLDRFVAYSDLKRDILRQTGSRDETEEATFCQGLKSRIKKKWVPRIDLLIATTNKADGYRLRAYAEL